MGAFSFKPLSLCLSVINILPIYPLPVHLSAYLPSHYGVILRKEFFSLISLGPFEFVYTPTYYLNNLGNDKKWQVRLHQMQRVEDVKRSLQNGRASSCSSSAKNVDPVCAKNSRRWNCKWTSNSQAKTKRAKQAVLRSTNGQCMCEAVLTSGASRKPQLKDALRLHITPGRMITIKKKTKQNKKISKCWEPREKEFNTAVWGIIISKSLWKSACSSFKVLKRDPLWLSYTTPGSIPKGISQHPQRCLQSMFVGLLFAISSILGDYRWINKWVKKVSHNGISSVHKEAWNPVICTWSWRSLQGGGKGGCGESMGTCMEMARWSLLVCIIYVHWRKC